MKDARRIVAIGDPQAPFATFLEILKLNRLLTDAQRLRDGVHLVSLGDHFDFGGSSTRDAAAQDGLDILRWLGSHTADQVTIIIGNHDIARVGELADFTDESFREARVLADEIYRTGAHEAEFLTRYPSVPDTECVARDFSCFTVAQRDLVTSLLRAGRLRLAAAFGSSLCIHAGITVDELKALKLPSTATAGEIASALNRFLDERIARWTTGALDLEPMHRPGSAARGEGVGLLFHRPADPQVDGDPSRFSKPPARRYSPLDLPRGITQVIGHIGDTKCRELMPNWVHGKAAPGELRSLVLEGNTVQYSPGVTPGAQVIFCDGAMAKTSPEDYRVHELTA